VRPLITNSDESAAAVALDASGGVYVGGYTNGALGGANLGIEDAWLARYDGFGNQTWIQQFGTSANDRIYAATPAGSSGVFVVGRTNGNIGAAPAGGFDAWIAGYDLPCGARFDYCTAGTTSGGCVPSISATGTPSVSANSGFTISIAGVDGVKQGLVFYGVDNTGFAPVPWGAGWLCIKPPLQRSPAQNSGGTLGQCDGSVVLDWNAFRAANPNALGSPFTAGQHVYAQGWFRDPPSAKTTSLSGALKFNLCP
jgi:hypothetical protein